MVVLQCLFFEVCNQLLKTVFYISHRLSTTRDADRIILLENGRIAEEGNHESLLKKNGKYAEMWNVQAGRYKEEITA